MKLVTDFRYFIFEAICRHFRPLPPLSTPRSRTRKPLVKKSFEIHLKIRKCPPFHRIKSQYVHSSEISREKHCKADYWPTKVAESVRAESGF